MRLSRVAVVIASVAVAVGAPLAAGAAASTSGVDQTTGGIAGTVTASDGRPIVGACVKVTSANPVPSDTRTDDMGAFSISGLLASPIDGYAVGIDPTCSSNPDADKYVAPPRQEVYVEAGQIAAANFVLVLGGSFTGTVVDSSGQPLPGVCAFAYPTSWGFGWAAAYAQTAADGSFVISGLPPDTYFFRFISCGGASGSGPNVQPQFYDNTQDQSKETLVSLAEGDSRQLNQQTMQPGGEIDLTLLTGGNVDPDVRPYLIPVDAPAGLVSTGDLIGPDGTGEWRFTQLMPISYEIAYGYCIPDDCRHGPIGFYPGVGPTGTPTPVSPDPTSGPSIISDSIEIPAIATTTTSLSAAPNPATPGEAITLTAKVTVPAGSPAPTGTVIFTDTDDWTSFGPPVQIDRNGIATVTASEAVVGAHHVVADYNGDGESTPSEGATTITVDATAQGGGSGGSGGGGGGAAPVSGTVNPGGSLSSDPAGTTPNASNPLIVSVTSPTGGSVSIDKTPPNTQIANYRVLNVGATITAPAATAASPLDLTFQVYDGALPNGSMPSDATVFRDGTPISACTSAGATPDPCVASTTTANGVTTIDVRSSHASTWDVEAADVGRVAGADRIATAVAASVDSFPDGNAGSVVLARADDYPDALVGAPLAASNNAPLLLTEGTQLPAATASEIKRVLPSGGSIYVLGGTAAVPASVADQLSGMGYHVVRYAGADRYATAVAVADALGNPATVLLATGTNFPDALAAGPAAAHVHGAVLLTEGNTLPGATSAYLAAHAQSVSAVGGPAAAADAAATPVFGADRYATAADVAATFFAAPQTAGVATGWNFPDALSGGAQLAKLDAPLLLAAPTSVPDATTSYFSARHGIVVTVHVYGGSAVLADAVINQLRAAVN